MSSTFRFTKREIKVLPSWAHWSLPPSVAAAVLCMLHKLQGEKLVCQMNSSNIRAKLLLILSHHHKSKQFSLSGKTVRYLSPLTLRRDTHSYLERGRCYLSSSHHRVSFPARFAVHFYIFGAVQLLLLATPEPSLGQLGETRPVLLYFCCKWSQAKQSASCPGGKTDYLASSLLLSPLNFKANKSIYDQLITRRDCSFCQIVRSVSIRLPLIDPGFEKDPVLEPGQAFISRVCWPG